MYTRKGDSYRPTTASIARSAQSVSTKLSSFACETEKPSPPASPPLWEQLENHHAFNGTCFDQSIRETIEKHLLVYGRYASGEVVT
ncbi:hypothetical protein CGRA01v4_05178 [Colletotrichum graminicola]|nr:hypothetical protein CGRA01v4_05178 [Colletotrichum graminicola]